MTLALLVNGSPPADLLHAVPAGDRGLHYGDGLFETALLKGGQVRFLDAHFDRLFNGCERLGITPPDRHILADEVAKVIGALRSGVLKIILTRGAGGRGYRPAPRLSANRIVALYALPEGEASQVLQVRWCETRLARNARLAGMKHLNRLEQVLAQGEWSDPQIGEGLMLDTEGELVCATSSNVFIVREGVLTTPDLRFCGVRGIMRAQVLRAAEGIGIPCSEEPLWPHDLELASEMFVTNAVRGIRPVVALGAQRWSPGRVAQRLTEMLGLTETLGLSGKPGL